MLGLDNCVTAQAVSTRFRQRAQNRKARTDLVYVLPFCRFALELCCADTSALGPIVELAVVVSGRLPHELARVRVDRPREPARFVRRELACLTLAACCALELFQLGFELVRTLKLAGFERVLIRAQAAVGRREPGPQVVVKVVQGDRERCPAGGSNMGQQVRDDACRALNSQAERCLWRFLRILPEADVFWYDLSRAVCRDRCIGCELTMPGTDTPSDQLRAPLAGDIPAFAAGRILDVPLDLGGVAAAPPPRLESERAGLASAVICDDHVAVVINDRVAEQEVRNRSGDLACTRTAHCQPLKALFGA